MKFTLMQNTKYFSSKMKLQTFFIVACDSLFCVYLICSLSVLYSWSGNWFYDIAHIFDMLTEYQNFYIPVNFFS